MSKNTFKSSETYHFASVAILAQAIFGSSQFGYGPLSASSASSASSTSSASSAPPWPPHAGLRRRALPRDADEPHPPTRRHAGLWRRALLHDADEFPPPPRRYAGLQRRALPHDADEPHPPPRRHAGAGLIAHLVSLLAILTRWCTSSSSSSSLIIPTRALAVVSGCAFSDGLETAPLGFSSSPRPVAKVSW